MKHLKTTILALLCLAAPCAAQRADNYPPTADAGVALGETNLPIVFINVDGRMIQKESRITARMTIVDNGEGRLNYADLTAHPGQHIDYDGYISIKYRGNSSFSSSDKKPYGFKTIDGTLENGGKKQKVELLGMGKDNDWALLAPFSDKSMIRDVLTFELGRPYFDYTPHSRFVEVMVDGTYYGIYILTERPGKGKKRLDLNDPGEDGGDLTGDYHVEVDRPDEAAYYTSAYRPLGADGQPIDNRSVVFQYDDPEYEDFADLPAGTAAAVNKAIGDMENALAADNYTDAEHGYRRYIDVTSFIDYLLSTEFSYNIDGYRLSTHLYKYSETRAQKKGLDSRWKTTLWDFNIAYGNADYNNGANTTLWQYDFNARSADQQLVPFWWKRMLADPWFVEQLQARWREYRSGAYSDANIETTIDSLTTQLTSHGAVDRNEQAWRMFGRYVWPNAYVGNSYSEEVAYLKSWIKKRVRFLDAQLLPEVAAATQPVAVRSGFNSDIIAEATPVRSHTSQGVDGNYAFYTPDVKAAGALPAGGIVTSGGGVTYALASPDDNNAAVIESGKTVTLNFDTPVSADAFHLLATSANGASRLRATVCYADGTQGDVQRVDLHDWYSVKFNGSEAAAGLGRVAQSGGFDPGLNFALFEAPLATDAGRKVSSLILSNVSTSGRAVVLAVSRTLPAEETAVKGVPQTAGSAATAYYSADGRRLQRPQKGINIVRHADGTVRKVAVR